MSRLRESMRWSAERLRPFRRTYYEMLKQYVGNNYGDNAAEDLVPSNALKLAIDIYQRQLSAQTPRVLVMTNNLSVKPHAYELELALNHLLQEINFGYTMKMAVKSALFSMGVIKVGITARQLDESVGWRHDAGQPYADLVLFDDWLHDMSARSSEEWSWCGNRFRVPLVDVVDNPIFEKGPREKLRSAADGESESFGEQNERSHVLSQGTSITIEEYEPYVELWDIWLPRENLLVTFSDKGDATPLRVVEWDGPERGPYHLLSLCGVPGNVMPLPPAAQLVDMHDLVNRLFVKLGEQAESQKTVAFASGASAADGTADAIINADDGKVIRSDDPQAVKEMRFGGVDQPTMAYLLWLRDHFSYMAGNLETMGGLTPQAQTLGQERLLKEGSNQLISEYQDIVVAFSRDVIRSLGYYLYHDPFLELSLMKPLRGSNAEVPFIWSPDRREADYYEFAIKVEPYSLQPRGPAERVQALMQLTTQVLLPMGQQLAQDGGRVKLDELLSIFARYYDLPEAADLVEFGGAPLDMKGQLGQPREQRQSPVTRRENVRFNVPAGAQQSPNNMAMQQLMTAAREG